MLSLMRFALPLTFGMYALGGSRRAAACGQREGMTNSNTTSVPNEPTQQLLVSIVQMLVDDGNAVEVDCFEENGVTTLNLRVAAADIGKVIGVVSHAMWRNSSQIIWRKQGSFDSRQ
jgi:hypothetical protein